MNYNFNKFAYEQDWPEWLTLTVIGKRYNQSAIILDAKWSGEDSLFLLLVEEDEDHPSLPFVITVLDVDCLDVRHDLQERYRSISDVLTAWGRLAS